MDSANKSTEDILIKISEDVLYSFEKNAFTEIAFMDVKSAYDTVWHKGLIYKLKNIVESSYF